MIDGDYLIINNKPYKRNTGHWKLLTNPNRKKLEKIHITLGGLTKVILEKKTYCV